MFHFIRRMVMAFLNRHRPFSPPDDPYASVREPLRRSPGAEVPPSLSQSRSLRGAFGRRYDGAGRGTAPSHRRLTDASHQHSGRYLLAP